MSDGAVKIRTRLIGLLVCSLAVVHAWAQLPGIAFSHYTTDEGLPHDFVRALTFDRAGFLWIGTHDGVARFDGRRFETFRHRDTFPN